MEFPHQIRIIISPNVIDDPKISYTTGPVHITLHFVYGPEKAIYFSIINKDVASKLLPKINDIITSDLKAQIPEFNENLYTSYTSTTENTHTINLHQNPYLAEILEFYLNTTFIYDNDNL